MNLPESWSETAGYSPLLIAVLILLAASLLVFFFAPAFFKTLKKRKLPSRVGFVKKHPRRLLAAILVVFVAIFGGYVYYYFSQPVRIVSAAEFKLEKGKQLRQLQQGGLGSWTEVGIYLLDVRSREEYAADHLQASESLPAERAIIEITPVKQVDIVVYSTEKRLEEARRVADAIKKKGESASARQREKFGRIYIIRDGFEGLKKAGLITESGEWD